MKKFAAIFAVLVMAIVIGACTPAPVAPPVTPPAPSDEVKTEPPAPAQLPDSAMPAEPAAEMPASTPAASNLPGTTWTVLYEGSEYTVTFNTDTEATIKGGEADAQAPDGLQGTYKVADGTLTVDIPSVGMTITGEYDGTVMKLNGNEAKKIETPAAAPADAAAPAADPAAPAAAPADAAAPAAAPAAATNFDDFNYEKGGGSASARR